MLIQTKKTLLPMAGRVDEVEAAVHTVVHNVSSVQATLILQVLLKLLVYVANHRFEAERQRGIYTLQ